MPGTTFCFNSIQLTWYFLSNPLVCPLLCGTGRTKQEGLTAPLRDQCTFSEQRTGCYLSPYQLRALCVVCAVMCRRINEEPQWWVGPTATPQKRPHPHKLHL